MIKPVKSKFIVNSFKLLSGSLVSNIITFSFFPVLTRLYTQEEIGLNSSLLSLTTFLTIFFSLQLNQSILIQKKKKNYNEITNLIVLISSLFLIIFLMIFYFFGSKIIKVLNLDIELHYLLLVPLLSFNISLFNTFKNWFIKKKSLNLITKNIIFKSISNNISLTLFGYYSFGYLGLFFSKLLSEVISTLHLYFNFRLVNKINFNLKNINKVLKENIKYPTVTLPHSVFTSLSSELPILLITSFFTPTLTGIYFLSIRVSSVPFQMISSSIGSIFSDELVNHPNKLFLFKKRFKELIILHILILLTVSFTYYNFIDLFFGYEFGVIGKYTTYFTILFCSKSLSSIFGNPVLLYLKKNELNFSFEIYNFITMLISIFFGIYYDSILLFINLNIITNIILIIIKITLCYKFLKN